MKFFVELLTLLLKSVLPCLLFLILGFIHYLDERHTLLNLLTLLTIYHHGIILQFHKTFVSSNDDPIGSRVEESVSLPIFAVAHEKQLLNLHNQLAELDVWDMDVRSAPKQPEILQRWLPSEPSSERRLFTE